MDLSSVYSRDDCCIPRNGSISWNQWCSLYYEIRPPSTCEGYEEPDESNDASLVSDHPSSPRIISAWFGGDPHLQTLDDVDISCNVLGSFVYARTTSSTNSRINGRADSGSVTEVVDLVRNDLFAIHARTSTTPARLRIDSFLNQPVTYFSSFTMYLGSRNEVVLDVDINATSSYQFCKGSSIDRTGRFILIRFQLWRFKPRTAVRKSIRFPCRMTSSNTTTTQSMPASPTCKTIHSRSSKRIE